MKDQTWNRLPSVKDALESYKWWIMGIEGVTLALPDDTLIPGFVRIREYLQDVINMLQGEKAKVKKRGYIRNLEMTKWWTEYLNNLVMMDLEGKFSPEARPFMASKLREVLAALQELIDDLEAAQD